MTQSEGSASAIKQSTPLSVIEFLPKPNLDELLFKFDQTAT